MIFNESDTKSKGWGLIQSQKGNSCLDSNICLCKSGRVRQVASRAVQAESQVREDQQNMEVKTHFGNILRQTFLDLFNPIDNLNHWKLINSVKSYRFGSSGHVDPIVSFDCQTWTAFFCSKWEERSTCIQILRLYLCTSNICLGTVWSTLPD